MFLFLETDISVSTEHLGHFVLCHSLKATCIDITLPGKHEPHFKIHFVLFTGCYGLSTYAPPKFVSPNTQHLVLRGGAFGR